MARRSNTRINVLVVDDDEDICEFMETFLSSEGFRVRTRTDANGHKPIEEEIRHGRYHLIILDLMMPEIDGIELLRRIRRVDSDVAIVIFTGYPSLDTAVQSMKLDVVDYVKKPFNPEEFRLVLDRVLRKKGLARAPEEALHRALGETMRNLRMERELTLKDIARRTGLSVSMLSQIERAESSASISSLYKIATALGVAVSDLFGNY